MSLILNKCYFCLFKDAEHEVEDQGDVYHLCPDCKEQFDAALENVGKNPLELPRQNVSDICCQCGLCCVVLAARTQKEEAERLLEQANATGRHPHDVTIDQFCTLQESPPYRGELVMNFPCVYLKGSVLNYVACRAYDLDRPSVCGSYLCKIAVQYKLGLISLPEAKFLLRGSFLSGDVGIFNWNQGEAQPDEQRISLLMDVSSFVDRIKEAGVKEEDWDWAVAQYITPEYLPSSAVSRSLLNMHLSNVDHENFNLELYVPELYEGWSEVERAAASHTLESVLRDIRKLFIRADKIGEVVDKEPEPEEEISVDELASMMGLVIEHMPEDPVLEQLSNEERKEIMDWCAGVHLEASDNEVDPPVGAAPKCLRDLLPEGSFYKNWRMDDEGYGEVCKV